MDALGPIRPPDPRGARPAPRARVPAAADPPPPAPVAPTGGGDSVEGRYVGAPGSPGGAGRPPSGGASFPAFDEAEVALILARAAELDALAPGGSLPLTGSEGRRLSLADLESVAIEAGIDPHHVRAAASEVALRRGASTEVATPVKAYMGLPERVDGERVLAGTLDDDTWGRMVQELRELTGAPGTVTTFGSVREWHSKAEGGAETVTCRVEPLATGLMRLTVSRNTSASGIMAVAFASVSAAIAAMFVVLFMVVPPADGLARLPAVLGITGGLGTLVTGATVVAGRRKLEKTRQEQDALLDRLELLALKGGGEGGR